MWINDYPKTKRETRYVDFVDALRIFLNNGKEHLEEDTKNLRNMTSHSGLFEQIVFARSIGVCMCLIPQSLFHLCPPRNTHTAERQHPIPHKAHIVT